MRIALVILLVLGACSKPAPTAEPTALYVPQLLTEPPTPITEPRTPTVYETPLFGTATWFDAERHNQTTWYTRKGITLYGAAGPGLRALVPHRWKQNYGVRITFLATGVSVDVRVVDWCSCNGTKRLGDERLIDLAPAVWHAAGYPLGYGVAKIRLDVLP
jgi:hypothetical protein